VANDTVCCFCYHDCDYKIDLKILAKLDWDAEHERVNKLNCKMMSEKVTKEAVEKAKIIFDDDIAQLRALDDPKRAEAILRKDIIDRDLTLRCPQCDNGKCDGSCCENIL